MHQLFTGSRPVVIVIISVLMGVVWNVRGVVKVWSLVTKWKLKLAIRSVVVYTHNFPLEITFWCDLLLHASFSNPCNLSNRVSTDGSFDTGYPVLSKCHQSFLHGLFKVSTKVSCSEWKRGIKNLTSSVNPNSFTIVTHFEIFSGTKLISECL